MINHLFGIIGIINKFGVKTLFGNFECFVKENYLNSTYMYNNMRIGSI